MNLTPEEYRQLEAIKVLYPWAKWLARDFTALILVFEKLPIKRFSYYSDDGKCRKLPYDLIPSLTWESEPLNIDEALEGRGCDRAEKLEKCINDLVFAYINKDEDLPHDFEVHAFELACELFPDAKLIKRIYDELYLKAYPEPNCGRRLEGRGCEIDTIISEIVTMLSDYREQQTVSKFPAAKECASYRQGIQAAIALVADYGKGVGA